MDNNTSKATQLELKAVELKNELNLVIDSILLTRSVKQLEALVCYLEQSIEDNSSDADLDRCDLCRTLTDKSQLVLTTNYEDLCPSCRKNDDAAYPSVSFFGVR
jgi:hypothetical protein